MFFLRDHANECGNNGSSCSVFKKKPQIIVCSFFFFFRFLINDESLFISDFNYSFIRKYIRYFPFTYVYDILFLNNSILISYL